MISLKFLIKRLFANFIIEQFGKIMSIKIAIINCYADEPDSAPSAQLFADNIPNTTMINHCHGEKINSIGQYDGYVISGSRSCHRDQDNWIIELKQLLKNIYKQDIPCLAVCFAHQLVAHTFGGTTVRNLTSEEGFQDVPTKIGDEHVRLFAGLPNPVKVFQSHNDGVIKAPPDSFQTIYTEKYVQYYQFGSILSIQSHPEIDIASAKRFAKRDNKDVKIILNGVQTENIQSQRILVNFYAIVENL